MPKTWLEILQDQVDQKGRPVVQKELAVSASSLSLVLAGKYPAKTDAIEAKVMAMYGAEGKVCCPHLGKIEPGTCVKNWQQAKKSKTAGNPATMRTLIACRNCTLRNT